MDVGSLKCDMNCLHCRLPICKHDLEDANKPETQPVSEPRKRGRPRIHPKVERSHRRGRPPKDRSNYWKEYYAKNGDRIRERNRENYWNNHDENIEKRRKRREEKKRMSFVNSLELGRSVVGNVKNNTWDVHPFVKIYEDDGKALVDYVKSLENRIKKLEEGEKV